MKRMVLLFAMVFSVTGISAQAPKTELYDFIKHLLYDSTGYENIGDWAVGNPKKYHVKWKADKIEMSNDTSINFFRIGTADIIVRGKPIQGPGGPAKWQVMLKGPRMGYGSFSIISTPASNLHSPITIDSLFMKQKFFAKLLHKCETNPVTGYYYYEVKLPKKDLAFIKFSWVKVNGLAALRVDGFDNYSKHAVKLDCK